jgi:hypothetical protein
MADVIPLPRRPAAPRSNPPASPANVVPLPVQPRATKPVKPARPKRVPLDVLLDAAAALARYKLCAVLSASAADPGVRDFADFQVGAELTRLHVKLDGVVAREIRTVLRGSHRVCRLKITLPALDGGGA